MMSDAYWSKVLCSVTVDKWLESSESSHSKPETLEALGSSPGQAIMSKTVFTETLKKKSKKKKVKATYRPYLF